MARIFFALALFAVGLLIANLILGLMIGDFNGLAQRYLAANREVELARTRSLPSEELQQAEQERQALTEAFLLAKSRRNLHFLLGVIASLVTVLVNSITVTYFIGTSRWCREVVESYSLDPELTARSTRLKRRTFPWALLGIMTMLAIASLGAASDPGGYFYKTSATFVTPHYLAALLGTALIAWSLLVQVGNIGANYEIIEEILAQVRRVRAERGLDENSAVAS